MTTINDTILRLLSWQHSYLADEDGQGLTEYGLIIALVAIAAVGALTTLGGGLSGKLEEISGSLGG